MVFPIHKADTLVVHVVHLENLLLVAVADHMEHIPQILGGGQGVVAGTDDGLEALLGTAPVLVEDLGFAEERLAGTGGHPVGAGHIVLAVAGSEVGQGRLELADAPVHQDLMIAVRRTGVTGEHVLHQRRGAPEGGQSEVRPGADGAGLGHALFLHLRVA